MQLVAHVVRRLDRIIDEFEHQRRGDAGAKSQRQPDQDVER